MPRKMSRREFAAAVAAGTVAGQSKPVRAAAAKAAPKAAAQAAPGAALPYEGPLAGLAGKVGGRSFDSLDFTRSEYATAELRMRFRARTRTEAIAWQKRLRRKLTELLGGFPARRTALNAASLDHRAFTGFTRERVVFQSRPQSTVFAYLLLPAGAKSPRPAIVCLPGHGRGADPVAGIDEQGELDTAGREYQHRFGAQAVEHGYAALVVEMLGFGCRRDPAARRRSSGTSSCQPSAGAALLLGGTMAGWRTWDVMRAIDYLAARPEVDSRRVACMGISGGGTVTLYAAALDPRIRTAVFSGSVASYRDSIFSIAHCIDNYVPGILDWAEMGDVAALIAQRPVFVDSGERDNIFPVASAREVVAGLRQVYGLWGAENSVGHEVFAGDHSFYGKGAFAFLEKHL